MSYPTPHKRAKGKVYRVWQHFGEDGFIEQAVHTTAKAARQTVRKLRQLMRARRPAPYREGFDPDFIIGHWNRRIRITRTTHSKWLKEFHEMNHEEKQWERGYSRD